MSLMQQIESAWLDAAASVIVSQVAAYPHEQFYAAGFWLCYVDYTMFAGPVFAMNTESHLAANCGDWPEGYTRWSPPNWRFDVLRGAIEAMSPYYDALTASLAGQETAIWDGAIEAHWQTLARVSRLLTHAVRSGAAPFAGSSLPSSFVVGIFEEREGEPVFSRLVRESIDPEILITLPSPIWEPS
jgi:hypothetical protein